MLLAARQLHCARAYDPARTSAIHGFTADFPEASLTMLTGQPGCGKNLLLRLLGLLETPDSGEVLVDGRPASTLADTERIALRGRRFGYVFAGTFLLPAFSVIENVAVPLFKVLGMNPDEARTRAEKWLEFTGIADEAATPAAGLPAPLAARAAFARALAHEPEVLFVEKLDAHAEQAAQLYFLSLMQRLRDDLGTTVIVTAATRSLAAFTDRVIEMESGIVQYDSHPVSS